MESRGGEELKMCHTFLKANLIYALVWRAIGLAIEFA